MNLRKVLTSAILCGALCCAGAAVSAEELMKESYDMTGKEPTLTIEAEDGDYKINVITGGDTETNANVYINGGERVRAYTLEAGEEQDNEQYAVPKDGKITIEVLGDSPNVKEIKIEQLPEREKREHPAIFIAGDSTAQTYNYATAYPQTGWGQVFADYFTDEITVENRSMGGRSSKSFDNDGRLDKILSEICPGDYLLIQFGINDGAVEKPERYISVEDYKKLITDKYIGEAVKRGAIPILLTATAASWWDEENQEFMESRQDYAVPTREIAEETGTALIDVNKIAEESYNTELTKDEVFSMYFICEPLESAAYITGTDDHTHLKEKGARAQAVYIVNELKKIDGLADYIVTDPADLYEDIEGHWAESAIREYSDKFVLNGRSKTEFEPEEDVTRAEFLKMAMEQAGICGHAYREGECLDAGAEDWYRFYVQSAVDKGIIPIEMVSGCTEKVTETKTLAEATEDTDAVTADVYVYKSDGTAEFDGDKPINRAEMAGLLYNVMKYKGMTDDNVKTVSYTDSSDIPDWAADGVNILSSMGILEGYDEGDFRPGNTLTRAEAVMVVSRLEK